MQTKSAPPKKQYADTGTYESKLAKVMERFGVTEDKYNYSVDRRGCWVEFWIGAQLYRFEHSVENAQRHGVKIVYGSDSFAQLVLTLEDLARMQERGIYDLPVWLSGLKALPTPKMLPAWVLVFGFADFPPTLDLVRSEYKTMARHIHPDVGGGTEAMATLNDAMEQAEKYFKEMDGRN